jgi:hypothetical protein
MIWRYFTFVGNIPICKGSKKGWEIKGGNLVLDLANVPGRQARKVRKRLLPPFYA